MPSIQVVYIAGAIVGGIAVFMGFWAAVTTLLGTFAGWFRLQRRYPEAEEDRLQTLRIGSAWMGGIEFQGVLTLSAGLTGLHFAISRLLGPFQRPFTVPWREIHAQRVSGVFGAKAQLNLGGGAGSIRIAEKDWAALVAFAKERAAYD